MVVQDSVKLITNGWIDADAPLRGSRGRAIKTARARFSSFSPFSFLIFVYLFLPALPFFSFPFVRPDRVNMKSRERVESRSTAAMDTITPRDVYEMISATQWHLDPGGGRGAERCFNNERRSTFRFHLVSPSIKISNLTQSYRKDETRCERHLLLS